MAQSFRMGNFVNDQFDKDPKFDFSMNNSPAVRKAYIRGVPLGGQSQVNKEYSLVNYVNMEITVESNGDYYFNVLDGTFLGGTLNSRTVVDDGTPDYNPLIPSDNKSVVEFIGTDDVRQNLNVADVNDPKVYLRVSAGVRLKIKIEDGVVKVRKQ